MQREGINPENVQMSDILCDFCLTPWREEGLFIEGHEGSVICGPCLKIAWLEVQDDVEVLIPVGVKCTMCLEDRMKDCAGWQSPVNEKAWVCKGCVELASETIEKDAETDWQRPGR